MVVQFTCKEDSVAVPLIIFTVDSINSDPEEEKPGLLKY